jgi:hypothetical protein
VAVLLAGVAAWVRRLRAPGETGDTEARALSGRALAGAALGVGALVALSGAGGVGPQTWDWGKHHAVLKDLITHPWPVAYATGADDAALTYYVAYYLPAALVGKAAGWTAANLALFAWTAAGAVLAFLWLVVLSGASPWRCLALFALFSGLDFVGAATWSSRWPDGGWMRDFHAEWWAGRWVYPNNVTLLAFAPHQALGGWLLTALTLDGLRRAPGRHPHALGGALGLLWSPLATIGLAGLAVLDWTGTWSRGRRLAVRDGADLAGGVLALALATYFLSRAWPLGLPARYYPPLAALEAARLALVPGGLPGPRFAADYAVFTVLEFGLAAALLAAARRECLPDRRWLAVATLTLLALPFVRYGAFNDLAMRASIPALFVLQVLAARALVGPGWPRGAAAALALTLAIGALYPLNMLRIQATGIVRRGALVRVADPGDVRDLFRQQRDVGYYFFVGQYVAALDAPFFRYLARPAVPVPIEQAGR